ncbi:MAG: hypothetical protein A2079_03255 [Geobacteraceae bacterium GWC2_48_7]|nr:MAG: hypothetical protein A2079_03255 [Geobacteraceae bacterium GWC2_48_7]
MIRIKRVYDQPEVDDGARFLVDRLWPRGIKKEQLHMDGWLKEVAPSDDLRHWFGHEPGRWEDFCDRYYDELEGNRESWNPLLDIARMKNITLLFSAHDLERNNAVALRSFLEKQLESDQ